MLSGLAVHDGKIFTSGYDNKIIISDGNTLEIFKVLKTKYPIYDLIVRKKRIYSALDEGDILVWATQ
jgi:hypothetical protein